MSYANPTDQEEASLEVACTRCGARHGQWCVTKNGKSWATYLHANRVWPYETGWSAGYQEARDDHLKMVRDYTPQQLLEFQQRVLDGKRW